MSDCGYFPGAGWRRTDVCALGAMNAAGMDIPLSRHDLSEEYEAIEFGWDGVPFDRAEAQSDLGYVPGDFYLLGAELRERHQPEHIDAEPT